MARLKANGRELLRVSREREVAGDECVEWERVTRTYHENGYCLEKRDVRFKADGTARSGERYSAGWKRRGKVKAGLTPAQVAELYRGKGWEIVSADGVRCDRPIRPEGGRRR